MENTRNDPNLEWIRKGNTGCGFASIFAKNPECVGWKRIPITTPYQRLEIPEDAFIVSYLFPEYLNKETVRLWALENGFYEESTGEGLTGLRYKVGNNVSWVQYFGPDSHVKTRQAPEPELLFTVKLPKKYYFKVGFNGILHLAHAAVDCIREKIVDNVWDNSFKSTRRILGKSPSIREAAKTTFENK